MSKKKAYVVGTKVKTSLSPAIFNYWFDKYNVDGEYGYIEIEEKNFEKEIKTILKDSDLVGLNITMPYKEKIIPYLKHKERDWTTLDHTAKNTGAVNHIIKNISGGWTGCNSDDFGFGKAIEPFEKQIKTKTAIVIGYGGAAKAIIYNLLIKGYKRIGLFNRSFEKIEKIYNLNIFKDHDYYKSRVKIYKLEELKEHTRDARLIINTTPTNPLKSSIKWNIDDNTLGFDAAYRPKGGTGFLNRFKSQKRIEGIYMLVWQALPCWNGWFAGPDPTTNPEAGGRLIKNRAEIDEGLINHLFNKIDENK